MPITPSGLIDIVKRTARFGTYSNNTDQAAVDLLTHLRMRLRQIWRFHDWEWSLVDVSIALAANAFNVTLASTIGELTELYVVGQAGDIKRYSRRMWLQWKRQVATADRGIVRGYINRGRDSSGNIRLRFFDTPASAVTIEGWAKQRFTAPIASTITSAIDYFPDDMEDVIFAFLLADGYKLMGDDRAQGQERMALKTLTDLRGEEESQADLDPQSPPPDYVRYVRRNRVGTKVV